MVFCVDVSALVHLKDIVTIVLYDTFVGVGALVQLMILLSIGRGGLSCFGADTEVSTAV